MEFLHCDNSENYISLHDCIAEKVYFQDGVLGFEFEDGFWILPGHKESNNAEPVRTDCSKAEFALDKTYSDDFVVYIFKKYPFGITLRKELSLEKFIEMVNRKENEFVFFYQYTDDWQRIIEGVFRSEKKPYFLECELKMNTSKVNYYWNNLREDRVW